MYSRTIRPQNCVSSFNAEKDSHKMTKRIFWAGPSGTAPVERLVGEFDSNLARELEQRVPKEPSAPKTLLSSSSSNCGFPIQRRPCLSTPCVLSGCVPVKLTEKRCVCVWSVRRRTHTPTKFRSSFLEIQSLAFRFSVSVQSNQQSNHETL